MSHASVHLTTHKAPYVVEKSVMSLEINHLEPTAYVLPDEINAMENYAHCNGILATMSDEVDVLFMVPLSPFDCAQSPVSGVKIGKIS